METTKIATQVATDLIESNKKYKDEIHKGIDYIYTDYGISSLFVNRTHCITIEPDMTYVTLDSKPKVDRANAYFSLMNKEIALNWIDGKPHALSGDGDWIELDPSTPHQMNSLANLAYA